MTSQVIQRLPELGQFGISKLARALDLVRDAAKLSSQRFTLLRQVDEDPALIVGVAATSHVARALQPLEQRRNGASVHPELGTQLADSARRPAMQFQHHQILGKGKAQRFQ